MILKDLKPRIFLEYSWESVEVTYEEAELAAYTFRLGWGRKLQAIGLQNIDERAKRLDGLIGKNWKYRTANFKIIIGKKEQILTPYYAFLLFVGERYNWDLPQLARFFGRKDLTKAMHVLKELLPFIQISSLEDKQFSAAKIDANKKASLVAFSWESVRDLAKRLKEEGMPKEMGMREREKKLGLEKEKRHEEAKRRWEEKRARIQAQNELEEKERRKEWLDKKLRSFLNEQRTREKNSSYGIDALDLKRGTENEKENVRKKYSHIIAKIKKEKGWE
ncbi:TPA: hypothetical protein H1012_03535 [archaeon]|nr:hypothetical protein [Candidatus Naiadarchaeales archaeon SRR2090159.bin1288]